MVDTELAERYRDDPGRPMRSTASQPIRASQPAAETPRCPGWHRQCCPRTAWLIAQYARQKYPLGQGNKLW